MDEHEAETERSEDEFAEESAPNSNVNDAPAADSEGETDDAQSGKAGDSLAWLEGPAFDSPIEEMPTLQWPDIEAAAQETSSPDRPDSSEIEGDGDDKELEDAMQWLESLAREQGTPLDEMPTLISVGEREQSDGVADVPELGATTQPPQLDSDPMAWLEQLAIDQNSPLEELPSVADRLLASEIASQTAFEYEEPPRPLNSQPLELEEALRFLEEEAAAQGISLSDVSYDEAAADESLDEELVAVDRMATAAGAAAAGEMMAEGHDEELPAEGAEDELAWLEEADASATDEAQEELTAEAAAPAGKEHGSLLAKAGTAAAAAKIVGEMGGDEDEELAPEEEAAEIGEGETVDAMEDESASGEQLHATAEMPAGAGLVEAHEEAIDEGQRTKPPETIAGGDQETPAATDEGGELEAAAATLDEEALPATPVKNAPDDDRDSSLLKKAAAAAAVKKTAGMMAGDNQALESEGEDGQATTESGEGTAQADDAILDSMPDDPDEAMAWMGALADDEAADAAPFEGEEQVLEPGPERFTDEDALDGMPEDPDEAMKWMAALAAKEAATRLRDQEPAASDVAGEQLTAEKKADELAAAAQDEAQDGAHLEAEDRGAGGLDQARGALDAGDVAEAVTHYRALLDSGEERGELIAALQTAVEQRPREPALQELLGDAYMQEGQVQHALRIYRQGLTNS